MSGFIRSNLQDVISINRQCNSAADMLYRSAGYCFDEIVHITGVTGTVNLNVFKVTGTVRIISQIAEISEVTTLTNCTNVYADLWDGTNSVLLTNDSPGAVLSGAPVGTVFTRDQDSTNSYSVSIADQCRVNETTNSKEIGLPFTVTQKNGSDTYIRFNFTTADNPIDFKIRVIFQWQPINGGNLELV